MAVSTDSLDKLRSLLRTLFQFDAAELDFGIYRIMNFKRKEIEAFIEKDLIQGVKKEFEKYIAEGSKELLEKINEKKKEIEAIEKSLNKKILKDGIIVPEYKDSQIGKEYLELKKQLDAVEVSEAVRAQVFVDLYNFFYRYYEDGDFISRRRKNDKYAIPYDGEEVKLYWANYDQYYVKSGELFKNYDFNARGWKVAFKTSLPENAAGNDRGDKRYFVLAVDSPVKVDEPQKTCLVQFEYKSLAEAEVKKYSVRTRSGEEKKTGITQDDLNAILQHRIIEQVASAELKSILLEKVSGGKNGEEKTVLEKHLYKYTHKITSDFFIHKDLKGFLERELDYFIKSEVIDLDNLEPRAVSRVKVVEGIGKRIIEFLCQIEEFQKLLWEKKKFVLKTDYVITIDKVPEEFHKEILENKKQLQEWQELGFNIDLKTKPQSSNLQIFQSSNLFLPVDTKHFDSSFKERLLEKLSGQGNLDDLINGVLIKSENWQALNLIAGKYLGQIQCIYIDPPFNTGTNEFLYKNNYLNSTWLSMELDRLQKGKELLYQKGNIFLRIDHHGDFYVRQLLATVFGYDNFQNQIILKRGRETAGTRGKLEIASETLFWFSKASDPKFQDIIVPRPIANVQWTAFLMGGERHPRERVFLGKTLVPPNDQHFALSQPKVDKLLDEYFLRLRCKNCAAIYFKAENDLRLQRHMKEKVNRYKFYDITASKIVHGVQSMNQCLECGSDDWVVDYLGAPTENVSNLWIDIESYARTTGFFTENSEELLKRVIDFSSEKGEYVADFFLGSGTTTAVAHKLGRKWIGVEMGNYFEDIPFKRMKLVLGGDKSGISKEVSWKGGGIFKYHYLEQYDDTLHNIDFPNEGQGQGVLKLLHQSNGANEYVMKYFLKYETQGSPSLLNLKYFENPFEYKLKIISGNKGEEITNVDLVETFNYLIGLKVNKYKFARENGRKYAIVLGERGNRKVAVVWRPTPGIDLAKDKAVIDKLIGAYHPEEVFINGDAYYKDYKVIENEFKALMGV